jgi:hypothetical protein
MEECYFSKKDTPCPYHESENHKIKHWHYKDGKAELYFYHLRQHNIQFTSIVQTFKEDFEISSKHKQKIQGGDLLLLESSDRKTLTTSIQNFDISSIPTTKVFSVSESTYVELNNSSSLDSLSSKFHLEEKKLTQEKKQFLVYSTNMDEKTLENDFKLLKEIKTMTIFEDLLHGEYEKLNMNSFEDFIQIEEMNQKSEEEKRRENGYYIKEIINFLRKKTLTKEISFNTFEILNFMDLKKEIISNSQFETLIQAFKDKMNEKCDLKNLNSLMVHLNQIHKDVSLSLFEYFEKYDWKIYVDQLILDQMLILYGISIQDENFYFPILKKNKVNQIETEEVYIGYFNWIQLYNDKSLKFDPLRKNLHELLKQRIKQFRYSMHFDVLTYLSCHLGTLKMVEHLVDERIVDLTESMDSFGNTPLLWSQYYQNNEVSEYLKEKLIEKKMEVDQDYINEFCKKYQNNGDYIHLETQ